MKLIILKITKLLILCFIFSSCTKLAPKFNFYGKVIDPFTKRPIIGAQIVLWNQPLFGDLYKVATTITDEQGNYLIVTSENFMEITLENDGLNNYDFCDRNGKISSLGGYKYVKYVNNNTSDYKVDFIDSAPMGVIIFSITYPNVGHGILSKLEVNDDKLFKDWADTTNIWNYDSIKNQYIRYIDVRANDSLLINISKQKNNEDIIESYKHYVTAFHTDTIHITF